MKMLKIFLRDLKMNTRSFLSLWILIIPIVLGAIINIATPGMTDSFLNVAMLKGESADKVEFYEKYAAVELFENTAQIEKRVIDRDFCFGILPDSTGGYYILSEGNEPQTVLDAVKLLKTYEEKGKTPQGDVSFTDLGRTTPPLKSVLITGLLILVTIMAGMLISLGIVEEKNDKTIQAFKVAPVSMTNFVVGKSLIGVLYTLLCSFAILLLGRYLTKNVFQILLVLLASSFISFIVGFLTGLTSDDFIGAVGNVKLIMIPALVPILVTELVATKWHFLVWWSPFYWSYDAVKGLLNQTISTSRVLIDCGIVVAISVVIYLLLLPKVNRGLK